MVWTWVAGGVVVALLAIMGFLVSRSFGETEDLRAEVSRSYETRAELRRVLSLHQDIETGQRGYVITGERRFLAPYEGAGEQIEQALRDLSAHWLAGSPMLPRVAELSRASTAKRLEHLNRAILSKAFRGELASQDPNDEPAEVMLARLRSSEPEQPKPSSRRRSKPKAAE